MLCRSFSASLTLANPLPDVKRRSCHRELKHVAKMQGRASNEVRVDDSPVKRGTPAKLIASYASDCEAEGCKEEQQERRRCGASGGACGAAVAVRAIPDLWI